MNVKGVGKPSAGSLTVGAHPSLLCLLGSSEHLCFCSTELCDLLCLILSALHLPLGQCTGGNHKVQKCLDCTKSRGN